MEDWFAVSKEGLAQLLERRGKTFALYELISNCWDTDSTVVEVTLKGAGRGKCELVVTDDDPNGFADLTHAYTLFESSNKKGSAEKRGRFNLGEKLVLAICDEATISSTKGAVRFSAKGRESLKDKRPIGSEFRAIIRMTKPEMEEACRLVQTLIPPFGVVTTFNGQQLVDRIPVHEFKQQLPTEIADEEGNMRPSARITTIKVFDPLTGETPMIYEMGIPVVENNDRWHYDIGQKVPLSMDRDNVKPSYLRHLRTLVLNEMHETITEEDANATWTKEAIEDSRVTAEALATVVEKRFGDKVVSYDPSDKEANNLAVSQGYTVVHGRSLSKDAWSNIRQHELIRPAGQVTPSNTSLLQQALNADPDGDEMREVPPNKWTPGQRRIAEYAVRLSEELLGFASVIKIISDIKIPALAYYGGRSLTFNVGRLGHNWFDLPDQQAVDELLIHEFAHDQAHNHLDHSFHDETCRLGARMRGVHVSLEDIA